MKRTAVALSALLLALTACAGEDEPEVDPAERAAVRAAHALADSAERALAPVPLLTADARRDLRRHLNAAHLASAREHGVGAVEDSAAVARLAVAGALVPLEDTTGHWVVRELDHSLGFVTPDTRAMLVEIGQRFHQRLDSLGIPRFRFEVSSVLRTSALQAELRRGNSNASRGTSSHEHGTTVDIAYNAFSPPAPEAPSMRALVGSAARDARLAGLAIASATKALRDVAGERTAELKAIMGEVLREMQSEGKLRALHERAQPVYHITVAAPYRATPRAASE